jgi:hypothetical protein
LIDIPTHLIVLFYSPSTYEYNSLSFYFRLLDIMFLRFAMLRVQPGLATTPVTRLKTNNVALGTSTTPSTRNTKRTPVNKGSLVSKGTAAKGITG